MLEHPELHARYATAVYDQIELLSVNTARLASTIVLTDQLKNISTRSN